LLRVVRDRDLRRHSAWPRLGGDAESSAQSVSGMALTLMILGGLSAIWFG